MSNPSNSKAREKFVAGTLMTVSAGKAAEIIDRFLSWLTAGTGATIALLASNLDGLSAYISAQTIQCSAQVFLCGALLAVIVKFFSALLIGVADGASKAREIAMSISPDDEFDFELIFQEFERATFWPTRWFVKRSFAKTRSGDITAGPRKHAYLAQITAILGLASTAFMAAAITIIVRGFGG